MGLFDFFRRKKPVAPVAPQDEEKVASQPVEAPSSETPAEVAPACKEVAKKVPESAKKPEPEPVKSEKKSASGSAQTFAVKAKTADQALPYATTEKDYQLALEQMNAELEEKIAANGNRAVGKYEFRLEEDGFHFFLSANNGQVLFDSPSFTTLIGALTGIKTFRKTVAAAEFDIKKDKYDRFRFILANKYYGENYTSKEQCQKSVESVKNFADNARILPYVSDPDAVAAFQKAKLKKRTPEDVDWNAIAEAEAVAVKFGKFEISKENDAFCFYLVANNGQILYSSRYYPSEPACRKGIDSFKRAAYVGNFFVDSDKFGTYRYVLKNIGSAPAFIGESYDNRSQCEKAIESVKKFIVTASIEE